MDVAGYRDWYPITKSGLFLNHAATSPVSAATVKRLQALTGEMIEPLGKHFYRWLGIAEETRRFLAELLKAHPKEIAFTQNTSMSLSLIAAGVRWKPGDRVLVPRDEFPSNRYAWQNLKDCGVDCEFFDLKKEESLVETLSRCNLDGVRLISVSLVGYHSGRLHDLRAFSQFCQERGILSCVDAIQAIGAVPVDLSNADIDFLASGAQKWLLAPTGCGILYINQKRLEEMHVPLVGWTSTQYPERFHLPDLDFAAEATRFEPGLPDILPIGGLNESMRQLQQVGWDNVFAKIQSNSAYLWNALSAIPDLELLAPSLEETAGIITCRLPGDQLPRDYQAQLEEKDITVTVRDGDIRVSPHFYTTQQELDQFLDIFGSAVKKPKKQLSQPAAPASAEDAWVIVSGAAGILGLQIARRFAQRGYRLALMDREASELESLKKELQQDHGSETELILVDYEEEKSVRQAFDTLQQTGHKYTALVNSAGLVSVDPFTEADLSEMERQFDVNVLATAKLTQLFLTQLRDPKALGILNIVSASGRCGYPLLSSYGAANGALWTWSEALGREMAKEDLTVTTFVAPAMHSKMQKVIGRTALRYFKMSGEFDYAHADEVAEEAVEALLQGKSLAMRRSNWWQLVVNAVYPKLVSKKIAKFWRPEEGKN